MVLYEMMTLKRPFEDNSAFEIGKLTESGFIPEISEEIEERYKNIIPLFQQCLNVDPSQRPTVKEFKEFLAQL